jgi:hypothetical protein
MPTVTESELKSRPGLARPQTTKLATAPRIVFLVKWPKRPKMWSLSKNLRSAFG